MWVEIYKKATYGKAADGQVELTATCETNNLFKEGIYFGRVGIKKNQCLAANESLG